MNPRQGMWSVGAPPLHKAYLACHLWSGNVRERTRTGILRSNCNQTTVLNHPRQRSCEIPILTCVPPDAVLSVLVHDEIDPDVPPAVRQTVPPGQLAREAGHLRHALERERLHPDPVVRVARARVRPGRQQDVKPSTATSDAAGHAGRRQPRHSGAAPRPTDVRADGLTSARGRLDSGCTVGTTCTGASPPQETFASLASVRSCGGSPSPRGGDLRWHRK